MTTKAGRWLRVSSDTQDHQNQIARVDTYIQARGYEAVKTYEAQDMSASKLEHLPLLREAIADMRAGIIDVLVIRRTDRIDRTEDLGSILREVKEAGGRIESVEESWLADMSGLGGKLMTSVTEFMNAEYTRELASNVRDALTRRRALGSYAGGAPPYGYDVIGIHADGTVHERPRVCLECYPDRGGRKTLRPNDGAPVVRRIFAESAAGVSTGKIARALTAEGVAPPTSAWSDGSVRQIIQNPVYRGLVQVRGVTYMTVEPLVPSTDWLKANQGLKARGRNPGRNGGRPLGALLAPVCGACGGKLYRYGKSYRCAGKSPLRKGCGNTIPIIQLDAEITAEFEAADDQEIIETVTPGHDWQEEIAAAQLAIKDLDVMADDYDERHSALMAELRRLRSLPAEEPSYWAEPTGRTEGDAFKVMDLDERRAFVRLWTLTVFAPGTEPRWRLTYERSQGYEDLHRSYRKP